MIIKAMIKFRSKFQFPEKVENRDGNDQKLWQEPEFFQLSHFGYYFDFSWLIFQYSEYKVTLT